jgi:calcineurin-like phosphoesterase family protein
MQSIWFTSDQHFGHSNVIQFCNRPFANVEEMNEALIENHNKVIRKGDLVYVLGDMFWRSLTLQQAMTIRARLNGQMFYVNGNHEELLRKKELSSQFIWCKDLAKIHPVGYPHIILCHYAMRTWEGAHRGDWQLFGHSHNGLLASVQGSTKEESALSFDIGVDAWGMCPVSLEQVAETMKLIKETADAKFNTIEG